MNHNDGLSNVGLANGRPSFDRSTDGCNRKIAEKMNRR